MKAIVISRLGGPDVLELQDVPDPAPVAGQELVRVHAGGLNFADVMTTQGGYPGTPKPPLVAGREFCGVRESDGQRVMGYAQWAAFAERIAARAELLWPVPEELDGRGGSSLPGELLYRIFRILEGRSDRYARNQSRVRFREC
jgi:NADPH:quinone reductase